LSLAASSTRLDKVILRELVDTMDLFCLIYLKLSSL